MDIFKLLKLNDSGTMIRQIPHFDLGKESKNQSVTGRLGLNHVVRTGRKSWARQSISIFQSVICLWVGDMATISIKNKNVSVQTLQMLFALCHLEKSQTSPRLLHEQTGGLVRNTQHSP